jgi:hypothetical protein
MKRETHYIEGHAALENFEEGMKALFKVPKKKAAKAQKKSSSSAPERSQRRKRGS